MNIAVPELTWKTYEQAEKWFASHPIRMHEVPISSWTSLPLPTRRWGQGSWAWFRAAQVVRPGQSRIGDPDCWWAMDAKTGRLLAYAREDAIAVLHQSAASAPAKHDQVAATTQATSETEQRDALARLAAAIDRVAEAFFENRWAPASNRQEVVQTLAFVTPREMIPFYRALAPDFFAWLEQA